ncbi:lysophospholipid acyltransferase family protein [Rhodopseudomonas sp. HC1]|uniref:lysophospholipid acyltransferase family protein n=1 Tax=Rhodopseudomonas infernalis TaxID=2897386 RepID=UPI001EE83A19|nr:lysophospholipid acyltransferase family protein [Rhodopseudomonas infernalis]MCG6207881.1 lysophospholipid acyltransferase family protein [Rhodopseudomonas infernalis]
MATPAFVKRILRTDAFQWAATIPAATYMQFVLWTGRLDRAEVPVPEPYILAMWHGRLIMLPMLRGRGKPLIALISGHRDGQIISKAGAMFGIRTAVGSSSKGGMRAAREMMRLARDGHSLFVTPDGPRGPRMRINSDGILDLARLTGLPVLPVGVGMQRGKLLRSWDRLLLPGLFSKIAIRYGEPLIVDGQADRAEIGARLAASLTAVQQEADRLVGREPVEPA